MAHPLYILCCNSGAVDKQTNQVSHFNVIEQLQLHQPPKGALGIVAALSLQVVSVWVRDSDDKSSDPFEVEIKIQRTDKTIETLHKATFTFAEAKNHRFVINLSLLPRPDLQSGEYRFDSRIRKVGTTKWIRHEYVIPVEVVPHSDDVPEPKTASKKKRVAKRP